MDHDLVPVSGQDGSIDTLSARANVAPLVQDKLCEVDITTG